MFADQPDQCHQPDLGVDVHARQAQEQWQQRPADRQRYRNQDHQRIPETFELGRQDQEDDRQCQAKGHPQCAAFLHVLAGHAGIVEGVTFRCLFAGDVLHGLQRFAQADHRYALNDGRVQLLELVELPRASAVGEGDQGRQRQQLALVVLHIVVVQPAGVVAVCALGLGNDLVAAPLEGETVDFGFTQQGGQGTAENVHRYPHLRRLGPVDIDHHLGFVKGQVDVEEGELARCLGPSLDALGHLQQCRVVACGVDHELERQAFAGAGQRRQVEAEDLQAGDLFQLGLYQWQQLHLRTLALVPGLEQEATDAALHTIETVDLERRIVFGEGLEQRGELVGVCVEVVKVGWLRGTADHEDHPLVLVGGQFVLGELQQ